MKKIYKVTQAQLKTLQNGGTITVDGVQYTYETGEDVTYVVVDPSSPEYKLEQIDDKVELLKNGTVVSDLSIAYADRSGYSTYSHTMVYPNTDSPDYVFSLNDGGWLSNIKDTTMSFPNYSIHFPKTGGTVALTKDIPDVSGKYDTSNVGISTMAVTRASSKSTSDYGYWAAMCNSSETGSPTLPGSGWWHVISMDWSYPDISNWYSQLALPTQDGGVPHYRRNTASGTSIEDSTWHAFITDENIGSQSVNYATLAGEANSDGNGNNIVNTYVKKGTSTTSATTGIKASQESHTHTLTPSGTNEVKTSETATTSVKTGITATSSAPSFTGYQVETTAANPSVVVTDNGHIHKYDKVTSATFNGESSSVSITNGKIASKDSGHTHTYVKTAQVLFTGKEGVTDEKTPAITVEDPGHTHTYARSRIYYDPNNYAISLTYTSTTTGARVCGIAVSQESHTHTLTPSGTNMIVTTSAATESGEASITSSQQKSSGTVTPVGSISLAYTGTSTDIDATSGEAVPVKTGIKASQAAHTHKVTTGGEVAAPTITIIDTGHKHNYDKTTAVIFTGTSGATSSSTPSITITDNGHTHTV